MHRCARRVAKPQPRQRGFRRAGRPLQEPQPYRSGTPCKASRIGPDANFRDRSEGVVRQGRDYLVWQTVVLQSRCRKHSSRSSCTFWRDLSIEQSSGRQFPDLRARAESGSRTRSARDTMREDDRVVVSRSGDLAPVEQTGRATLVPNGLAPLCSWRTQNYLFPTWQDELALRRARWCAGTSAGRRSTPRGIGQERRVTCRESSRLLQGQRDPRTYLLLSQRGVRDLAHPGSLRGDGNSWRDLRALAVDSRHPEGSPLNP